MKKDRKEIIEIPHEFPLILILFRPNFIEVITEDDYKLLIDLLEGFENPKMIKMSFGLSLIRDESTFLKLSNYRESMKADNYQNLDLYNQVVEIAIKRGLNLSNIVSFAFISDMPHLKEVKYINAIIFPWNEENNYDSMIKIWEKHVIQKSIDYKKVKLVFDGMNINEFMKIYLYFIEKKVKIHIHLKTDLQKLVNFLTESIGYHNSWAQIFMWNSNGYIMWNLISKASLINLRDSYYKPDVSDYAIKISNAELTYLNDEGNNSSIFGVYQEKIVCLEFCFKTIYAKDHRYNDIRKTLHLNEDLIRFSSSNIKKMELRQNTEEKFIYYFHSKIPISSNYCLKLNYSKNENRIKLKVTNASLNADEVENLAKEIKNFGYIYSISLLMNEAASAIIFLNYCKHLLFLRFIEIELKKKCSLIESFEIGIVVKELKNQGVRVKIIIPSTILSTYSSA